MPMANLTYLIFMDDGLRRHELLFNTPIRTPNMDKVAGAGVVHQDVRCGTHLHTTSGYFNGRYPQRSGLSRCSFRGRKA